MIKINEIIWKETFVKKIEGKHRVTMVEVEEILHGRKKVYRIAKGDVIRVRLRTPSKFINPYIIRVL